MLKTEAFLSFLLILMGSIDCLTTVIGFQYSKANELNPLMANILRANIGDFLVLKIGITIFTALTYILANRMIMAVRIKTGVPLEHTLKLVKVAYIGIVLFLVVVVTNNLLILAT